MADVIKCYELYTGRRNLDVNYKMGDTVLNTTVKEKNLGVSADMKVSDQCGCSVLHTFIILTKRG